MAVMITAVPLYATACRIESDFGSKLPGDAADELQDDYRGR
jgi:hypothetical protein